MELTELFPPVLKERKSIVSPDVLVGIKESIQEQGFVIVHVFCPPQSESYAIRVWKSTFLVSGNTEHKSKLMHAEKITLAPEWLLIDEYQPYSFSLIFEGLPKDVEVFDLLESIPEPDGFHYKNICRNARDVYAIRL